MLPKRVLFLASCVALVAGADARALLAEPNAVRVAAVDEKDRVCVACKQFVTEGEQYINDPATLDKVALEVKKLCKDQGDESEQCERFMEDVVDYAVGFVNDKLTPKEFCARLGFCGGDETQTSGFSESNAFHCLVRQAVESPDDPPKPANAADCLKCKFGVSALHEAASSNETIDALVLKADDACEKYAKSLDLAKTCEAAVATYAPVVVAKATAFLADPAKVCVEIGMCPPPVLVGEQQTTASKSKAVFQKIVQLASEQAASMGGNTLSKISFLNAVRGGHVA